MPEGSVAGRAAAFDFARRLADRTFVEHLHAIGMDTSDETRDAIVAVEPSTPVGLAFTAAVQDERKRRSLIAIVDDSTAVGYRFAWSTPATIDEDR